MNKYVCVSVYHCPACKQQIPESEVFADCKPTQATYGPIVLADIYCTCGFKLASNEIVDDSGLIPPRK